MDGIMHSMFHPELPVLEKVIRPIIVYLCLIVFLRLFGKRELAQLNPLDLVDYRMKHVVVHDPSLHSSPRIIKIR